jgi:hypothetical protein
MRIAAIGGAAALLVLLLGRGAEVLVLGADEEGLFSREAA